MELENYVTRACEEMKHMPIQCIKMYAYGLSGAKFCNPDGKQTAEAQQLASMGETLLNSWKLTHNLLDTIIECIAKVEYAHKFSGRSEEVSEINRYIEAYRLN